MVQNWENFMSPTGGLFDNQLVSGGWGLGVGIGASLAPRMLFDSLERKDLSTARNRLFQRASARSFRPGGQYSIDEAGAKNYGKRIASAYKKVANPIKSRYSGLRGGARAIGYAYAAMFAAETVESMVTPGLTSSALSDMSANIQEGPLDSSQAYTQRQRALQAIFDSQMGVRNVIGQEASFFHK